MKISLLNHLVCPECQVPFACLHPKHEDGEIESATLRCPKCRDTYPVRDFIPRLVPKGVTPEKQETAKAFGWEWNHFSQIHDLAGYKEQFLDWVYPVDRKAFEGKVVLDAGCGMGRFPQVASSLGAKEVLAVDLSDAVEAAFKNTRHLANVHVVQTDIYRLPFKKIDLIYSIGVLHHLPDPQQGFRSLTSHLKPDGLISVWVYGRENNDWVVQWLNPIRKTLTSKLPRIVLYWLSFLLGVPLHLTIKTLYRPTTLNGWRRELPYASYLQWLSKYNFVHTHHVIFDHLVAPTAFYLRREEFEQWFREAKLSNVQISWRNENSWRGNGRLNGTHQRA